MKAFADDFTHLSMYMYCDHFEGQNVILGRLSIFWPFLWNHNLWTSFLKFVIFVDLDRKNEVHGSIAIYGPLAMNYHW